MNGFCSLIIDITFFIYTFRFKKVLKKIKKTHYFYSRSFLIVIYQITYNASLHGKPYEQDER